MNAAAINNGLSGLYLFSEDAAVIHNIAATENGPAGAQDIQFSGAGTNAFSGIVKVTDLTTSCVGISATSGLGAMCAPQNGSTANVVTGSASTGLFGQAGTEDVANGSDAAGLAAFDAVTDWVNFDTAFRGYARYATGLTFPACGLRGGCRSGESCAVWDFALRSTDTTALRGVLTAPTTGNEVLEHVWGVTTATDCANFADATWDQAQSRCSTTFLRNAVEVFFDDIGNDNGLCESNEACAVSANLGGYQGHGSLVPAATIGAGGEVENVQLYSYGLNGY